MAFRTHAQKVCSLYKRAARCMDAKCKNRLDYRYNVTILRARFDANKSLKDMAKVENLIEEGEEELYSSMFIEPKRIDYIPSNSVLEQKVTPPDWVLDSWYPIDQAAYPEYFERREQRKKQYMEWWSKQYGKPTEKHNMNKS